jgi:4-oxalocrotonate tautomerase
MPFVQIDLTREGVTPEQKEKLIKGVTDLITEVLNKDPQLTHIVINEHDLFLSSAPGESPQIKNHKK